MFLPMAAPEKAGRAGQAGSGGRRAGQGLQNFQSEKWELVLFLPRGGKWEKRILVHLPDTPRKPFLG